MVYLYKLTNNKLYINRASKAAKWLIKNAQHKDGGFKCLFVIDKKSPHAYKKNLIYSFDNGVILNGLCSLYKITKKEYLLKSAKKCASWVSNYCVDKNHNVIPVYDLDSNKFYESDKEWSTTSGSYHTKVSMGFANYYSITKDKKYLKLANLICKNSLKYQQKDGRFVSFFSKGGTNIHPHCYSAEGLWSIGMFTNNINFLNKSLKALKWIINKTNSIGKPPRLYKDGKPIYNERIDIIAQTIRLNFLQNIAMRKNFMKKPTLLKMFKILEKFQITKNNDIKTFGSFIWGKTSTGKLVNHSNSWVTFFCIQCLELAKSIKFNKNYKMDPFDLV
jgi:hypothetical protein